MGASQNLTVVPPLFYRCISGRRPRRRPIPRQAANFAQQPPPIQRPFFQERIHSSGELNSPAKIPATGNIPSNSRFDRISSIAVKLTRMDPQTLTLASFQQHIKDRYEAVDRARGTPKTWMWFIEEIGELSHALAKADDRPNLEEEFADVLAWLCTLANINDVDLASVLINKYLSEKPPEGHK